MKSLSILLVLALFVPSLSRGSEPISLPAEENSQVDVELVEASAEEAAVQEKNFSLDITLRNGKKFTIPAPSTEEMRDYAELPPLKQAEFETKRASFLTKIARALTATKFALGLGSLVGTKISFLKTTFKKALGKDVPAEPSEKIAFSERGDRAVQILLEGIDKQMWAQAPLVVSANEYGVSASLSLIAEAGARSKGFGGVEELGVSFTVNSDTKAFVFEIFHNSERFHSSLATVAILAGIVKTGIMVNHRAPTPDGFTFKGNTYGPPVVPGYIAVAHDSFSAGPMLTVGLPPSPIADLMAYTNHFERNTLLRISISPFVKGFVRVEIGNPLRAARLMVAPFEAIFEYIKRKITGPRPLKGFAQCGAAFAS